MREKTSCTNHRMLWNYLQDICGCIVFFSGCYIFIRSFYVVWHHFISNKWLMQLMMTSINKPWSDLFPIAVYNWKTDENQFNTKACVMNRAEEHLLMGYSSRRPHSSSEQDTEATIFTVHQNETRQDWSHLVWWVHFCCHIQMVGSEFDENGMKVLIHLGFYQHSGWCRVNSHPTWVLLLIIRLWTRHLLMAASSRKTKHV